MHQVIIKILSSVLNISWLLALSPLFAIAPAFASPDSNRSEPLASINDCIRKLLPRDPHTPISFSVGYRLEEAAQSPSRVLNLAYQRWSDIPSSPFFPKSGLVGSIRTWDALTLPGRSSPWIGRLVRWTSNNDLRPIEGRVTGLQIEGAPGTGLVRPIKAFRVVLSGSGQLEIVPASGIRTLELLTVVVPKDAFLKGFGLDGRKASTMGFLRLNAALNKEVALFVKTQDFFEQLVVQGVFQELTKDGEDLSVIVRSESGLVEVPLSWIRAGKLTGASE